MAVKLSVKAGGGYWAGCWEPVPGPGKKMMPSWTREEL